MNNRPPPSRGLGRGLGSLIPTGPLATETRPAADQQDRTDADPDAQDTAAGAVSPPTSRAGSSPAPSAPSAPAPPPADWIGRIPPPPSTARPGQVSPDGAAADPTAAHVDRAAHEPPVGGA